MASELVERIWNGPWDGTLPSMGSLKRGERYMVTPEDAKSGHWAKPDAEKPAKPTKNDHVEVNG